MVYQQSISLKKIIHSWAYHAVVVERSRASYLIDVLGLLKIEGSKHSAS